MDAAEQAVEQLGEVVEPVKEAFPLMQVAIQFEGNVIQVKVPSDKCVSPKFTTFGGKRFLTGVMVY